MDVLNNVKPLEVNMRLSDDEEGQIFTEMALYDAVKQLSTKQRMVVALITAGYTREECSTILGITRQAVGFIYKRAIRKMRTYFSDEIAP
jgi:DNA-directed RNA polymerase specialized sigma24 family protein